MKLASQLAIRYRGTETVNELLEWPHDLLYQHCLRNSVSVAAYSGDRALLASLLDEGADMDIYDDYLGTPLYAAVCSKSAAVVELLLDYNANSNTEGKSGPPLTLALLLDHSDTGPDDCKHAGETLLWWASRYGHASVVKLLLERTDVNPNAHMDEGSTPLWEAAVREYSDTVRQLLQRQDLRPNILSYGGSTPLLAAIRGEHEDVVRLLLRCEAVDPNLKGESDALLARKESEVNSMGGDGDTGLSVACSRRHEAVARLLVAHKDISLLLGLHAARGGLQNSDHDDCLRWILLLNSKVFRQYFPT
ncbi:hypothetical protein RU639_008791 [Aspergillus parasiticus]